MANEEPYGISMSTKYKQRLKLNPFEVVVIASMLFVLAMASFDSLEGRRVGESDALEMAKRMGQQELMASRLR